jgi:CHAT domain-containing protein
MRPSPGIMTARRFVLRALSVALVLAGMTLLLAPLATARLRRPTLRQQMVALLAGRRSCASRFSGGFSWAPVAPPPNASREIEPLVRRIERELELRRTPRSVADAAVVRLILGRPDGALEQLRWATENAPKDAGIMNDLAAAYLARFETSHQPSDLIASLETAERAVALPGVASEAFFNRALATGGLFLHEQARLAWARYLSTDPDSAWAGEARSRLARLEGESERERWLTSRNELMRAAEQEAAKQVKLLVGRFPQRARLWAEEELLPAWARAQGEGHLQEAARLLAAARAIGVAVAEHHGERMLADAVAAVDGALGSHSRIAALAAGHLGYARGLALYDEARDAEALEQFAGAERLLVSGASPYSAWARFRAVLCSFYKGENRTVLSALEPLERELALSSYPSLLGRTRLLQGMAHGRLAEMAESLRGYRLALSTFLPTGETEHIAATHYMIAENLSLQGDFERAWEHRLEALSRSHRIAGSVYYYNTLRDGAEDLLRQERLRGALSLQNEMVALSHRERDRLEIVETLLARSRTHQRLGEMPRASSDLKRAAEWLKGVAPGERQLRLATDLELAHAEMSLTSDAAARAFDSALTRAAQRHDRFRLPSLFAKRAQARLLGGDLNGAISDLDAAIAESERQRFEIEEAPLRVSYLDKALPLYKDMIELLMKCGRTDRAYEFAERMRARRLLESAAAGDAPTGLPAVPSLRAIEARMDEGTTLIEFAVTAERTVAWLVRRGRTEVVELPLARAALEREVGLVRTTIKRGIGAAGSGTFPTLSRAFLQPLLERLPAGERLVIVPDECLYLLPFAALRHPTTGRYLIEEAALSYSPSAALYLRALALGERRRRQPLGSVLVVANPTLDPVAFPDLRSLPGARDEATALAALYPGADVLAGRAATPSAVIERARRHEVIHFATHAVPNFERPLLSSLPLAGPESGGAAALYAHEIEKMDLHHTRLVVLGACSTSLGRRSPSEGVLSLARSFIAAGVPAVVASSWLVDDRAAERLLIEFHRRLHGGDEPAVALRAAQLSLLRCGLPELAEPRSWAAFQLIGGLPPATIH